MAPGWIRKLLYLPLLLALCAAAVLWLHGRPAAMLGVALLLLPGRVQGHYYREFFRGRRLLEERAFEASLPHTLRFLEEIREHPGRKRLIWLGWAAWSADIEAMAHNNAGAALLELGHWDSATEHLERALELDPSYAVPFYNLAVLAAVRGNPAEAQRCAAEAARLGFRRDLLDEVLLGGGALLARVEGGGSPAGP